MSSTFWPRILFKRLNFMQTIIKNGTRKFQQQKNHSISDVRMWTRTLPCHSNYFNFWTKFSMYVVNRVCCFVLLWLLLLLNRNNKFAQTPNKFDEDKVCDCVYFDDVEIETWKKNTQNKFQIKANANSILARTKKCTLSLQIRVEFIFSNGCWMCNTCVAISI